VTLLFRKGRGGKRGNDTLTSDPLISISLHYPGFIEMRMTDRLGGGVSVGDFAG